MHGSWLLHVVPVNCFWSSLFFSKPPAKCGALLVSDQAIWYSAVYYSFKPKIPNNGTVLRKADKDYMCACIYMSNNKEIDQFQLTDRVSDWKKVTCPQTNKTNKKDSWTDSKKNVCFNIAVFPLYPFISWWWCLLHNALSCSCCSNGPKKNSPLN